MPGPSDYTVGWIRAIDRELVAARAFLDETHGRPEFVPVNDNNSYTLGRIGKHNVVIAVLPQYGLVNAGNVARDMVQSFPNVRMGLMVGIGGGVPRLKNDIRLGDIVVSAPSHGNPGVFQYDFGKTVQAHSFQHTQHLNSPPAFMLAAMADLQAEHELEGHNIDASISSILVSRPDLSPSTVARILKTTACMSPIGHTETKHMKRSYTEESPKIHYGLIASANQVMKDALIRDKLSAEQNVLCFKMEAPGLMNHFPCLIVTGICDYSDTHKHKRWQGYAKMAAAAYAKQLLYISAPNKNAKSFLWLYGIPGCGKVLSSTIIEELCQTVGSQNTLYFYFDFNDGTKQSLEMALRSLVSRGMQQSNLESLQNTFQQMADHAGELWIIIDALDECEHRHEYANGNVLSWLQSLQELCSNIHLLVTSRPEKEIRASISTWIGIQYTMSIQNNGLDEDIRAYVRARVREGKELKTRWHTRPDIQNEIEEALTKRANGISALTNLPETLDDTYARIIAKIPPEHKSSTITILQFLVISNHPVPLARLVDAVTVDTANCTFDPDDRMPIPEEISRYCSGLVSLVDINAQRQFSRQKGLQLSHFSVREYLVSNRMEHGVPRALEETNAHASIANICFIYLLSLGKKYPHISERGIQQEFPLLIYALSSWPDHLVEFFTNEVVFGTCYDFLNLDPFSVTETPSALHYASHAVLVDTVHALLDYGVDINTQKRDCGRENVVRALLQRGADANAHGGLFGSALGAAAYKGHVQVVLALLEGGANINAKHVDYGIALQAASRVGYEQIVLLLLDKGANPNIRSDGSYGNALTAASYAGHIHVVRHLLENGAVVNAQGGTYSQALQAASYAKHEDVVKILLHKGAHVNAKGGRYGNALQAALYQRQHHIVQILLRKGAVIDAEHGEHLIVLRVASSFSDSESN
ncbi:hypothetical protein GGR57DRAFT_495207 [Xylariaceae sp. FL1272]|nr:hypothetical protein GGR57DRAFT_495207 [Xylariaceae sp. FL1272]